MNIQSVYCAVCDDGPLEVPEGATLVFCSIEHRNQYEREHQEDGFTYDHC